MRTAAEIIAALIGSGSVFLLLAGETIARHIQARREGQ